jgi:uncharacterized membrane protein
LSSRKIELLIKVVSWRFFSMIYGFSVAYIFTGNMGESAGIVLITGTTLTVLQWMFEIAWDKIATTRIRNAISEQQGRIDRMVRWRRSSRAVSLDEHESRSDRGEESSDPKPPENAG